MRPSTGTTHCLAFRLMLALASVVAYAGLVQYTPVVEALESIPYAGTLFHLVVGAIFGAFVMAPYGQSPHRLKRGVTLALASAAIYYLAIRFVVGGPAALGTLATLVVAGACAALLCGASVAVVAPRPFTVKLALLLVAAGAAGGAVFDVKASFDPDLLIGHAAWQLLVCLALYFGFAATSSSAS